MLVGMKLPPIAWNRVTRASQLIAIVLFVGVFVLGFFLGRAYQRHTYLNATEAYLKGEL